MKRQIHPYPHQMKKTIHVLAGLLLFGTMVIGQKTPPPNIIVIMSDDHDANAISAYNTLERGKSMFTARDKSTLPCGSITCKQRGKKIKRALFEMSHYSEEALGSIGVTTTIKSFKNYKVNFYYNK